MAALSARLNTPPKQAVPSRNISKVDIASNDTVKEKVKLVQDTVFLFDNALSTVIWRISWWSDLPMPLISHSILYLL